MSEKTEVDQEYDMDEDASQSSGNVPEHQYSREELINLSKSQTSSRRPKCLDPVYDSEDGKWDPDRWYKAQFEKTGDVSPVTLADGKDRQRVNDLDRDLKRRTSLSDPVERQKEDRDGIVLGPQRRSFGTGCHVQTTLLYTRQLTLPDRDREEVRAEKERERERERPVRKIGSGRIQIDRENSRDYSGLRDRFDDRDIRDRDVRDRDQERDRDFVWNRDRERDWDRDVRETEWDRDRDRDRRFDRSDRFRRGGDRDFPDRDRRDRDFRDRGFGGNSRRRNTYRDEEKEPEWFTGGPSSQNDTIELRGFDREGVNDSETGDTKSEKKSDNRKRTTPSEDKSSKESSEADVKVSQRSSPEEDQQMQQSETHEHLDMPLQNHQEEQRTSTPQQHPRASPNYKLFDFDEILKASIIPLDEEPICQGSRFSRFFGIHGNKQGSDTSSMEDMLVPHDLLEESRTSSVSPTSMIGSMIAVRTHQRQGMQDLQDMQVGQIKEHVFSLSQGYMHVPNSAGDNNAAFDKSAVAPSVTALFNSAAFGGSNAPNNGNFSTQNAEAQLKALLFGGHKDSSSSSGTASPSGLPPSVQRKVKTVAELEADMHQNSPQKASSSLSVSSTTSNPTNSGDMTAFNKLLIMINAASETNQNASLADPQAPHVGFGLVPSHSEFNHAVMRNKEEQIQLQQQSLQNAQQSFHSQPPQLPPYPHHPYQQMPALNQQPPPPLMNQQPRPVAVFQHLQQKPHLNQQSTLNHPKQMAGFINKLPGTPGLPQAMSSSQNVTMKPRAHSGGPMVSSDPIYNLIQQNPKIVMNPASPGPSMAAILASQQSNAGRVPSPLIFSQQPPLHLSAPSPIHPGQLSPRSLGNNLVTGSINTPTGMRSPVMPRVPSPQEIAAHTQVVMQCALIRKQLQDQKGRYLKKQQERAKSPSQQQMNIAKPQAVASPGPPLKMIPVNNFTPTSVLRKIHSDKALEKEKQALEGRGDEEMEFLTSLHDLGGGHNDLLDISLDGNSRKSDKQLLEDLCDISFLDPVNPDLVAMTNQLENQLRVGQTNILPGPLSQPMSVEEKLKLSALAEKPGYLSQMLDKSAKASEAARIGQGRPIIKATVQDTPQEDMNLQQHLYAFQQQQQHQLPPPTIIQGRPVTGGSQPSFAGLPAVHSNLAQLSNIQQSVTNKPVGRAIVGGNSIQHQTQVPAVTAQNIDVLRMMDLQRLQQQMPPAQGMVLPPPPMGTPISCLGPPPVAVPISVRIPVVGAPVHSANAAMMHQQIARANAMSAHNNQQISHFFAMHQAQQQHRKMSPLPSHHMVASGVSAPISPRSQATGPLSPAALSATFQRVASPHLKINGPMPLTPTVNGGGGGPKVDLNSGIQRWFSPDILRTQLPSMPPLPTKGNQVMTVDELEGN